MDDVCKCLKCHVCWLCVCVVLVAVPAVSAAWNRNTAIDTHFKVENLRPKLTHIRVFIYCLSKPDVEAISLREETMISVRVIERRFEPLAVKHMPCVIANTVSMLFGVRAIREVKSCSECKLAAACFFEHLSDAEV